MDRRLILIRHAEAVSDGHINDIDRSLSKSGIEQSKLLGKFIRGVTIDKILVSPAKRTMQTLSTLLNAMLDGVAISVDRELYNQSESIKDIISRQDYSTNNLMVIGHNPGIMSTAMKLSNINSKYYDELLKSLMPPATMVVIDFEGLDSWEEINSRKGNITKLLIPKIADVA